MAAPPSSSTLSPQDALGLRAALAAARKSYAEGGVPIGASLVLPHPLGESSGEPVVLGQGHNARVQQNSPILHGETSALLDAGRLKAGVYRQATMVSALFVTMLRICASCHSCHAYQVTQELHISCTVYDSVAMRDVLWRYPALQDPETSNWREPQLCGGRGAPALSWR